MALIDGIDIESNLYNAAGGLERLYCNTEHFSAGVQHRCAAVFACNHLKTVHATGTYTRIASQGIRHPNSSTPTLLFLSVVRCSAHRVA